MKPNCNFSRVVNRKRYTVNDAILLASDDGQEAHHPRRPHRERFLYRSRLGAYFVVTMTNYDGESDTLEVLTVDEAISLYEGELRQHEVEFGQAFPDIEIEEG